MQPVNRSTALSTEPLIGYARGGDPLVVVFRRRRTVRLKQATDQDLWLIYLSFEKAGGTSLEAALASDLPKSPGPLLLLALETPSLAEDDTRDLENNDRT